MMFALILLLVIFSILAIGAGKRIQQLESQIVLLQLELLQQQQDNKTKWISQLKTRIN
jgi:hypothetical protein